MSLRFHIRVSYGGFQPWDGPSITVYPVETRTGSATVSSTASAATTASPGKRQGAAPLSGTAGLSVTQAKGAKHAVTTAASLQAAVSGLPPATVAIPSALAAIVQGQKATQETILVEALAGLALTYQAPQRASYALSMVIVPGVSINSHKDAQGEASIEAVAYATAGSPLYVPPPRHHRRHDAQTGEGRHEEATSGHHRRHDARSGSHKRR